MIGGRSVPRDRAADELSPWQRLAAAVLEQAACDAMLWSGVDDWARGKNTLSLRDYESALRFWEDGDYEGFVRIAGLPFGMVERLAKAVVRRERVSA